MSEIVFDSSGRDPSGYRCCPSCGHPHKSIECDNPGCFANPAVTEEQKTRWREAAEKRRLEEEEREKFRRVRDRAWSDMYPKKKASSG